MKYPLTGDMVLDNFRAVNSLEATTYLRPITAEEAASGEWEYIRDRGVWHRKVV